MFKWIALYQKSTSQTKYFFWMALVYGIATVGSTVYCYGRLDYVRSYKTPQPHLTKKEIKEYQK